VYKWGEPGPHSHSIRDAAARPLWKDVRGGFPFAGAEWETQSAVRHWLFVWCATTQPTLARNGPTLTDVEGSILVWESWGARLTVTAPYKYRSAVSF
jgi:hypothetical protein